jgi:hypothetical protein
MWHSNVLRFVMYLVMMLDPLVDDLIDRDAPKEADNRIEIIDHIWPSHIKDAESYP